MKKTRTAVSILLTVLALTAAASGFALAPLADATPAAEAPVQLAQSTSAILEVA